MSQLMRFHYLTHLGDQGVHLNLLTFTFYLLVATFNCHQLIAFAYSLDPDQD